jgi:hypothetical protein
MASAATVVAARCVFLVEAITNGLPRRYPVRYPTAANRSFWAINPPTRLIVHHVQNVAGLKYACAQEREKLAYEAQERWLGLFGHSLERDFELDGFSLLVKTRCFY